MRFASAVLSFAMLLGLLVPVARAEADTQQLLVSLESLVKSFDGGAGLWIGDPNAGPPLYERNADDQVITASLYKLAVMLHVESLVEQKKLAYTDTITIEEEDITEDGSLEEAGTVLSVDEALETMITYSDNGTALAFWHTLGAENMNATLSGQGIAGFHIAESADEDNVATPRAVGKLLTLLVKRQLLSAPASDRMVARLGRQHINDRLPSYLPEGTLVAHKTGNLAGVTHDAGIVYTPQGERVVVAMTWGTDASSSNEFIAGLGSLVYAAVLEPPANARYTLPKQLAADAGGTISFSARITNAGTKPWAVSGAGVVGLTYEVIDAKGAVTAKNASFIGLGAAPPGGSVNLPLLVQAPSARGDYTVRIGLTDAGGNALARLGAATSNFALRVHAPFVALARFSVPKILHAGEASLVVVQAAPLPAAGGVPHTLTLGYRVVETQAGKGVGSGAIPLGVLDPATGGAFFVSFIAPRVKGPYRIDLDLREGATPVSALTNITVTIGDERTYPGDELRVTPRINTRTTTAPKSKLPSLPNIQLPTIQLPKIQLPKGKTPAPTPAP